jgi:NADH dehydrogenase
MKAKNRVVVVGAGYAGTACAVRLARKSPEAEVVLVDARPYFVERIRLHEDVAGPTVRKRIPLQEHVGGGVQVVTGMVEGIDLENRRVFVGGRCEAFDELVIATGSSAATSPHAVSITTEEEALVARARLSAPSVKRVVVVGAGLTGTELVAELAHRRPGLSLTLVSSGELVPGTRPFFERHGVATFEHQRVAAFERDGVILESGAAIPSDVTVWTGGFVRSRLAVEYVPSVDDRLRSTTHPFVRVIGDASPTGLRMACAVAIPTGCYVADDLAGRATEAFSWRWVVTCVSLGRTDGVVQLESRRFDGRPASWFKEFICRFAMASTNEGWGLEYRWPHERRHRLSEDLRGRTFASLRDRVPDAR